MLYRSTKHYYAENSFEKLTPSCPMCRKRIHGKDLPFGRRDPLYKAKFEAERQRVISEPSFAQMSAEERPLRLTRQLIIVEKAERQKALADLMAQRDRIYGRSAKVSSDEPQPSTSSGITRRRARRAVLESDTSSSSPSVISQKTIPDYRPLSQEDPNVPKPAYSSGPAPPSPVKPGTSARESQSSDTSRSRSPIPLVDLTKSQTPSPEKTLAIEGPPKLQALPAPPDTMAIIEPRLQDLNRMISIIREQINQLPDQPTGVISEVQSPPHHDDDSDVEDDVVLTPVAIHGTWGRGRHMRYRVRWSDGSISLNPTREVERLAMPLLEEYRRELRRIATAKTREKQRRGDIPKIPGRGRGRGKRGGSGGSTGSRQS